MIVLYFIASQAQDADLRALPLFFPLMIAIDEEPASNDPERAILHPPPSPLLSR